VPEAYRNSIDVTTLPLVESKIFGGLLNDLLVSNGNPLLVVFASIPYTLHFLLPWTFALYLLKTGESPINFLWILGWLNTITVLTHFFFPTAPPWYFDQYGFAPANYGMKGDAALLKLADDLFQVKFFDGIYKANPVVFGAFPSLHAAWPFLIATYGVSSATFRKFAWIHVMWVWWAAIYLRHHYILDIIGGVVYVFVVRLVCDFISNRVQLRQASGGSTRVTFEVDGMEDCECENFFFSFFSRKDEKKRASMEIPDMDIV
jgi:hypothetical protein